MATQKNSGADKVPFPPNAYAAMESVGLQYGADEFGEGPVSDGRYASPKSGALYTPENFYEQASGSWYSAPGSAPGYGPQSSAGNYHNVNHSSNHMGPGPSHESSHYMSPHMDAPHMSTTPQPLPPMSSFRGSTNGPTTSVGPSPSNPALYANTAALGGHHGQHNLQNDTLVGKALQTVTIIISLLTPCS